MPKGKPLSAAHKAKIAAGVRAYHHKCASKPKAKAKPKPKPKPPPNQSDGDQGRKLRKVVDKIERKAAIQKDMARVWHIRGRQYNFMHIHLLKNH